MTNKFTYSLEDPNKDGANPSGILTITVSVGNGCYPCQLSAEKTLYVSGDRAVIHQDICQHIVTIDDLRPENDFDYYTIISLIASGFWGDNDYQVKWELLNQLLKVPHVYESLKQTFPEYIQKNSPVPSQRCCHEADIAMILWETKLPVKLPIMEDVKGTNPTVSWCMVDKYMAGE